MKSEAEIRALHATFCELTDVKLTLHLQRMDAWQLWAARGLTVEDLRQVVQHLRRGLRDGSRNPGALRFSNLIELPDRFEEELGMARAALRNARPQRTERERALAATGRAQERSGPPARAAGAVLEEAPDFAALKKMIQAI